MGQVALILGLVFISAAVAASTKRLAAMPMGEFHVYPDRVEELSQVYHWRPEAVSNEVLLEKIQQEYDAIVQEVEQAERNNEEFKFTVTEGDTGDGIRSVLLCRLRQKLSQLMNRTNPDEDICGEENAELLESIDSFIEQRMMEKMSIQRVRAPYTARVMALNPSDYIPIYRFDGGSGSFCYPDYPTSQNDGKCKGINQGAPVFYKEETCGSSKVYIYWLWYGWQKPCIGNTGSHGNDWEHISVYVNPSNRQVSKVVFHQHTGHYTRRRGEFERSGERTIVYIGKIAHGSYHSGCDGKCSFTEFIKYGCLGTVKYCQGGCGYWDDFRNPGPELRSLKLQPLKAGQTIDGITRPGSGSVCGLSSCKGSGSRVLHESGCWQNKP